VRLRTAATEAAMLIQQRDENARERESLGHQLHARNLEFEEASEVRDRLVGLIEELRARLAQVEADLDVVQTRRRDAESALRRSTKRLEALDRSYPIRVGRALKRLRRR
jgi:chromosome segregation ATPase